MPDKKAANSRENSMKKKHTRYGFTILVVCCIGTFIIGCRIEQHGFETVDQYSLEMGYGLCLQDGFLYATTNDGVELFEIGAGNELRQIQSIDLGVASFTILVQDSISFVGGEGGFTILRLPADESFQIMSQCSTAGTFVHKMSVRGDLLYVSDFHNGLSVMDISNLENPYAVSHHDLATGSWDLKVEEDVLYLANTTTGLLVFDITDPTEPNHIGVAESSRGARSIIISGDTLYLGTFIDGIKLYDISDARNPSLVHGILESEEVYAFHAGNGMLYCTRPEKGVSIYQLGDDVDPVEVGYFNTGLGHDALVSDSLVYFVGKTIYILRLVQ